MATIAALKRHLIAELFVRTADENYITARWCVVNGMYIDFFWMAAQAIEKYLKAVLLLNGRSAKGYGHNIARLYRDVKSIAGALLPDRLVQPANLQISHWHECTAERFIEQLARYGNPDSRYLVFGFQAEPEHLFMLDMMVFAIRRLFCPLDERYISADAGPSAPTITHRQLLEKDPRYYGRLSLPLDDALAGKNNTPLQSVATNMNLPFAQPDFEHEPVPSGWALRNPAIGLHVFDSLKSDDRGQAVAAIELANWMLDNIQLSKDVEGQIVRAIDDAQTKHEIRSDVSDPG